MTDVNDILRIAVRRARIAPQPPVSDNERSRCQERIAMLEREKTQLLEEHAWLVEELRVAAATLPPPPPPADPIFAPQLTTIKLLICQEYNFTMADLEALGRTRGLAEARHAVMYVA